MLLTQKLLYSCFGHTIPSFILQLVCVLFLSHFCWLCCVFNRLPLYLIARSFLLVIQWMCDCVFMHFFLFFLASKFVLGFGFGFYNWCCRLRLSHFHSASRSQCVLVNSIDLSIERTIRTEYSQNMLHRNGVIQKKETQLHANEAIERLASRFARDGNTTSK